MMSAAKPLEAAAPGTAEQIRELYGAAQSCLRNYNGKSVVRAGKGLPMCWKIIS